jgi:uroporphyrinogen decarboxylase
MTNREKFFRVVRREMEGYIPFEFRLCPKLKTKFEERTGIVDYSTYYDMPLKFVWLNFKKRDVDFLKYFSEKDLKEITSIDEWGIGYIEGSIEHFKKMLPPMGGFETIEEFMNFPYPDPDKDFDFSYTAEEVEATKKEDKVVMAAMDMTIFEISWYLRGMDTFMMDLLTEPELANYHLDRITEIRCNHAKKFAECGVDVLHLGDDVSTQLDMMISPEVWRTFLKPRLKKVIDAAREVNKNILIDYHGDGNLQKIIPDLIEIGVDILNPIQPECMDPVKIKELYGDKLSFRGTIGTQTTMPFGTPEDVERACMEMIEKVGKGGGLILAPTHLLEPEVPWENIESFVNTVKKYNARYEK